MMNSEEGPNPTGRRRRKRVQTSEEREKASEEWRRRRLLEIQEHREKINDKRRRRRLMETPEQREKRNAAERRRRRGETPEQREKRNAPRRRQSKMLTPEQMAKRNELQCLRRDMMDAEDRAAENLRTRVCQSKNTETISGGTPDAEDGEVDDDRTWQQQVTLNTTGEYEGEQDEQLERRHQRMKRLKRESQQRREAETLRNLRESRTTNSTELMDGGNDDVNRPASNATKVQCPICTRFFFPVSIRRHMLMHLPRAALPFQCKVCGKGFNSYSPYRQHYLKHVALDPPMTASTFTCDICSTPVETRIKFVAHLQEHRRAGESEVGEHEELLFYQCDSPGCWILFRDKVQFDHHVVTAHPNSLICKVCGKCFADAKNYEDHRRRAHTSDTNEVSCSYCWEIVKGNQLEAHRRKHVLILSETSIAQVICHICGKSLEGGMERHMSTVHGPSTSTTCQICGFISTSSRKLESHHLNVHTYDHPLVCHICSKEFRFLYILNSHLRAHEGIKRKTGFHNCLYCTKSFSWHIQRNKHQVLAHASPHLTFNPFHCTVCFRGFKLEQQFKAHMESHEKFRCGICNIYCISNSELKFHTETHDGRPRNKNNEAFQAKRRAAAEEKLMEVGTLFDTQTETEVDGIVKNTLEKITSQPRNSAYPGAVSWREIVSFRVRPGLRGVNEAGNVAVAPTPPAEDVPLLFPEHEESPYVCDQCPVQYNSEIGMRNHLKWHEYEKTGNVNLLAQAGGDNLPVLTEKHYNPKAISCPLCEKVFTYGHALSNHMKYHSHFENIQKASESYVRIEKSSKSAGDIIAPAMSSDVVEVDEQNQLSEPLKEASRDPALACGDITSQPSSSPPVIPTEQQMIRLTLILPMKTNLGRNPPPPSRIFTYHEVCHSREIEDPLEDPLANSLADVVSEASGPSEQYPFLRIVPLDKLISGKDLAVVEDNVHLEPNEELDDEWLNLHFQQEDAFQEQFEEDAEIYSYRPEEHLSVEDVRRRITNYHALLPEPLRQRVYALSFLTVTMPRMTLQPRPGRRYMLKRTEEEAELSDGEEQEREQGVNSLKKKNLRKSERHEPHTPSNASIKKEPAEDDTTNPGGVQNRAEVLGRSSQRVTRNSQKQNLRKGQKKPVYADDGTESETDESPGNHSDWSAEDDQGDWTPPVNKKRRISTRNRKNGKTPQKPANSVTASRRFKTMGAAESTEPIFDVNFTLEHSEINPVGADGGVDGSPVDVNEEESPSDSVRVKKITETSFDDGQSECGDEGGTETGKSIENDYDWVEPESGRKSQKKVRKKIKSLPKTPTRRSKLTAKIDVVEDERGKHPCPICGKLFNSTSACKTHRLRSHHSSKSQCPICKKTLHHSADMETHVKKHESAGFGDLRCPHCPQEYHFYESLKSHCRTKHGVEPPPRRKCEASVNSKAAFFYCHICSKKMERKSRFDRHLRVHLKNSADTRDLIMDGDVLFTFLCDATDCDTHFIRKETFLRHLETHSTTLSISYPCSNCPKVFAEEGNLGAHVESVHVKNQHDCDFCRSSFEDVATLQKHMEYIHKIDLNIPLTGDYTCEICGKSFRSEKTLDGHNFREHRDQASISTEEHARKALIPKWRKEFGGKVSNNKKQPCPICQKVLTIRTALPNHLLMTHTYEHGVVCFICSKQFTRYGLLTNHLKEHEERGDVNPNILLPRIPKTSKFFKMSNRDELEPKKRRNIWTCKYCNQRNSDLLRQNKHYFKCHQQEYLAETPFYCKYCYRAYATKEDLKEHQIKFHDDLKCKKCGRQFLRRELFRAHELSHKGERPLECELCDKTFNIIDNLRRHKERVHNAENPRAKDRRGHRSNRNVEELSSSSSSDSSGSENDQEEYVLPEETRMLANTNVPESRLPSGFSDLLELASRGPPISLSLFPGSGRPVYPVDRMASFPFDQNMFPSDTYNHGNKNNDIH